LVVSSIALRNAIADESLELLDGEPDTPADTDCSEFVLSDAFIDARPAHGEHLCCLGNADTQMS
jgi:hypothetical protein